MRTQDSDHDESLETKILYRDRLWGRGRAAEPVGEGAADRAGDLIDERWCLPAPDHPSAHWSSKPSPEAAWSFQSEA